MFCTITPKRLATLALAAAATASPSASATGSFRGTQSYEVEEDTSSSTPAGSSSSTEAVSSSEDDAAGRNAAMSPACAEARYAPPPGFGANDSDESASEPVPAAATRKVLFMDGTEISVTMGGEQTFGTLSLALIRLGEAEPGKLVDGLLPALQTQRVRFFVDGQEDARPEDEPLPDCGVPVFALVAEDEPLPVVGESVGMAYSADDLYMFYLYKNPNGQTHLLRWDEKELTSENQISDVKLQLSGSTGFTATVTTRASGRTLRLFSTDINADAAYLWERHQPQYARFKATLEAWKGLTSAEPSSSDEGSVLYAAAPPSPGYGGGRMMPNGDILLDHGPADAYENRFLDVEEVD